MPNARELANVLRFLSIDAIEKANSGHPGMPMGMADIAEVLWREFLKHNPKNPKWPNRDRFVISNGHGSMLLYSLLHMSGYDLTLDDLKQFRQLHSRTPGHPEYGETPGVETTTGPLGQGLSNAVGMALAEKILAAEFNRPEFPIVDHYTYVFCGDGCLMEGISHEACSLAGHHKLGKLILFWDSNYISIDGDTRGWFTENIPERFAAYGWHVIADVDGHNSEEIKKAINAARFNNEQPTIICCKTHLAFGSPHLHDNEKAHGSPLGKDEVQATRENLNWKYPPFAIPDEYYAAWNAVPRGKKLEAHWQEVFNQYQKQYSELAAEFLRRVNNQLPVEWQKKSSQFIAEKLIDNKAEATRKSSQNCLNAYAPLLPELIGGSADLTGSNLTNWSGSIDITPENAKGNYLHFGVREFGMSGILNGLALHGEIIPYGGTFLVFSDYARNAIRLAAMMKIRVIFVLTHDSVGLGEDGPTHQPIEQLSALRLIPNLAVWRPSDELETAVAWKCAIENVNGPSALVLSRQKITPAKHDSAANIDRGGYILQECSGKPEAIIIATGSEVPLAIATAERLKSKGRQIRVVSMPCAELFAKQDIAYQNKVLPKDVKVRMAIEAGSSNYWYKYVGLDGRVIGIDQFGRSAPAEKVFAELGFKEENCAGILEGLLP